jgi:hypothetical protein
MAIQWNYNFEGTTTFTDVCTQVNLIANSDQSWTIPGVSTMKFEALFSFYSTANVFVSLNAAVVIPGADTSGTQQYCDFRPYKRYVKGGDVLHFKTTDATQYVGVGLRQLPG